MLAAKNAMRRGAGLSTPRMPLNVEAGRHYRWVTGKAYLGVADGEQVKQFTVELSKQNIEERKHFDDPANRLHRNDLGGPFLDRLIGKPFRAEHGVDQYGRPNKRYGTGNRGVIDSALINDQNELVVFGRVFVEDENDEHGYNMVTDIDDGKLGSLSIKWNTVYDEATNTVLDKDIVEVSLCNKPHYAGCVLTAACSQPASKAGSYRTHGEQPTVNSVERIVILTMSASQQNPQTTAAGTTPAPAATNPAPAAAPAAAATGNAPTLQNSAVVLQNLTAKLGEESASRTAAEQKLAEVTKQLAEIKAAQDAQLNAQKEEALKVAPHVLQQLRKFGEVDQITQDTTEMLAQVLAAPVENPNQQLGQLITACSAKMEQQEKTIAMLSAQVQRTGDAANVATLTMAASHASDMMGLVDEDRGRKQAPAAAAQGQKIGSLGVSLPSSFYGDWGATVGEPQPAPGNSLRDRLASRSGGVAAPVQYGAPQQQQQQQQQYYAPQQMHMQQGTTRTVETAASAMTSQQQGGGGEAEMRQSFINRVANMSRQRAADLMPIGTFKLAPGEQLPTYPGDRF